MKRTFHARDFEDLSSSDPRIRYGRVKQLLALAKSEPALLYPHLDVFADLLKSGNTIFVWTAIDVIALSASVDTAKRIGRLLPRILAFFDSGRLITVNHAIFACATIAGARPEYRRRLTRALLTVGDRAYETAECRNIALGKAILALESYPVPEALVADVQDFVRGQAGNSRSATRRKAEKFLARTAKTQIGKGTSRRASSKKSPAAPAAT